MENSPEVGGPLSIESRTLTNGAIQLALIGELDLATMSLLDQALDAADAWSKPVIFDLRRLEFVDSSGLHSILRVDRRLQENGGTLTIVRGPRAVERLFKLTGLDSRLNIVGPDEVVSGAT